MSQLSHAQFPLRRHPNLLVDHRRNRSAAVAEPRGANGEAVTGSGGRLHFGMVAGIKSERWPTSNRNPRPDCLGIRNNESFSGSNEKLQVDFDAIYTAEDIGSYKPSSRNFEYMLAKLKTLGIEKHQILHTAESMFHDHGPANTHGLASCWIFRRHGQDGFGATMHPDEMPKYDFRFTSMAGLVEAHQDALRG